MRRGLVRLTGAAVALLLMAGCADPAPPSPPPPATSAVPTPTFTATEQAFATNVNPLLGLPSEHAEIAGQRPRAYAVASWSEGQAPAGLQSAEIVFESRHPPAPHLTALSAEAVGTRPDVGPLRDATWSDLAVSRGFGAELVAAGAQPDVRQAISASGIAATLLLGGDLPVGTPLLRGEETREGPGWAFGDAPTGGAPASEVGFTALADEGEAPTWRFDPVFGIWRRFHGDGPAVDAATSEGLTTANIVLMAVPAPPTGAPWWLGEGPALVLGAGTVREAVWARTGANDPPSLRESDGSPVVLRPGNTWIALLPDLSGAAQVR